MDAKIADLTVVADRKIGIGEAEILDETVDRRVKPEYKRTDLHAKSGSAEPLVQLIRWQVADLHEVDGAISPNSSSSRIR